MNIFRKYLHKVVQVWWYWTDKHPFWAVALAYPEFLLIFACYWIEHHSTKEYKIINTWERMLKGIYH